ncbi:MAG TPA: bifunctional precorrin-2 dehydrogenase/sirohydrochlorin ferrochelatase [Syntrophorhabdales bacterium]|nr:bifunctional precorrin-2 dehydrogenase/sirohydrochlorin ferrochelatase [Syntrophorhabdales bacterium]
MKANRYYPLFFDLTGRLCLVVGGGRVADRKVRSILKCGARVHVICPQACKSIRALHHTRKIKLTERAYRPADLQGATLVFAATNDIQTNLRVSQDARKKQIPVNVADSPDLCDFIVPAVVTQGSVIIAISTSGTLPMLARKLREEIERQLSKDLARYAVKVGRLRKLLMERVGDRKKRQKILKEISAAGISELAAMSVKELRDRFLMKNR